MSLPRRALALVVTLAVPTLLAAQTYPSKDDPRSKLTPGLKDAGVAAKNMRLVSESGKPAEFDSTRGLTFVNSDLAFRDKYVYQGNFAGFMIWDVSNPATPKLVSTVQCITSQGDPTIVGNLLFISAEGAGNRNDCAKGGVTDPKDHMAGVRIFDVSNPAAPRLIKNVQTCKGSHTHTLMPSPKDKNILYIYVSGSQGARPNTEVAGCREGTDPADETNSLFRLDVIKVDIRHPEKAEVVTGARIFTGLDAAPRAASRPNRFRPPGGDSTRPAPMPTGPRNCHDVTIYPAAKLLAGACGSYGLLVDVSNPEKPIRIDAKADTNFSLWHTAVFSNDGKKVVFTDEWGGGTSPMCQANSMMEMGGNTVLTIDRNRKYKQHAYFKIPTAQSAEENCVSHNGGLIPVPGRDVMVQGWYQGGVSVMDFTNADKPVELAYFDRGSIDPPPGVDVPLTPQQQPGNRGRGTIGGSWGAYYWNGYIYSSELARGFDIMELEPSDQLSKNEIEAAKLVRFVEYNPQSQPKIEWPAAFPVVRSYLDQLVRGQGLTAARTTAIGAALDAAEAQQGAKRKAALTALAREVDRDVAGAKDPERVRWMSDAIRKLARETR
ncbi:MAG: hypothetical protein IT361_11485 [Gemmatimonadaceae bacterium]|nr:hypothetical protein [Gemmatimonadaceae bacterium]